MESSSGPEKAQSAAALEVNVFMKNNITDAETFGMAIRRRRKELGYTQSFISDFTGLSVSFLSDLENGKKTIELEKAISVAMILGMNLTVEPRGEYEQ